MKKRKKKAKFPKNPCSRCGWAKSLHHGSKEATIRYKRSGNGPCS